MMKAPIVLFAYNRCDHLKQVVESLAKNPEAKESILYIFADGPKIKAVSEELSEDEKNSIKQKNEKNKEAVAKVREYISSLNDTSLFKEIHITESEKNKGLATSVISGVDSVIKKHGKVIVVEDDAVCSTGFLAFMNDALDFYESYREKVWFIGGYAPKLDIPADYPHDYYLMGRGSSYAWATWIDRWNKVDWEVKLYKKLRYNYVKRKCFNKYGMDRANMIDCQMNHKVDSWAIRFAFSMFCNNMYALLPTKSYIKTIGRDGSGTHTTKVSHEFDVELVNANKKVVFEDISIDQRLVKQHVSYFKRPRLFLIKEFIKNNLLCK